MPAQPISLQTRLIPDMRAPEYNQGYRSGVKCAVSWLHWQAREMNDPWAKAILNVAADHLGKDGKEHTLEAKARLLEIVLARANGQSTPEGE